MATGPEVLVVGAGMAGLCAGLAALESGARTTIVEKAPAPGGSMRMSGGSVWTAPSMEVMERWVPGGDRARQHQLVDGLMPGVAWLESKGAPMGGSIENPRQVGRQLDVQAFTDWMATAIQASGGVIRTRIALADLVVGDDGRVSGAVVVDPSGRRSAIDAHAVILATGGFQGDPELLRRHIGPFADSMLRRANPYSVGDALLAAQAIGARTSPDLRSFYGHTMPALPADPPPARWTAVTQYYSQDAILVNERGERFFDESTSMADERAAAHIVQQPNGRAFLVMDRRIHDDVHLPGRSPIRVGSTFDAAVAQGAPSLCVDSVEDLADALAGWGVNRSGFLTTIRELQAAFDAGHGRELPVPRTGSPFGMVEPPLYAVAVRAGITFTLGGLDVDTSMRVLDRDGQPIRGLFAAGADAGGTYQGGYMGGLVLGLVQGRIAGSRAAGVGRERGVT